MSELSIQDWGREPPAVDETEDSETKKSPPPSWKPSSATIEAIIKGDDLDETDAKAD